MELVELSPDEAFGFNAGLEYAAQWIEYSANGAEPAVAQFAANQAMSIRAAKKPVEQEDFFDAVRADQDMTPEQKAKWLAFEQELNEK